jgi:hypothetical protein
LWVCFGCDEIHMQFLFKKWWWYIFFLCFEDWRWIFNDNDLKKEIYSFIFDKWTNTWSMRVLLMFESLFYSCFVHKMRKCHQYILIFISSKRDKKVSLSSWCLFFKLFIKIKISFSKYFICFLFLRKRLIISVES